MSVTITSSIVRPPRGSAAAAGSLAPRALPGNALLSLPIADLLPLLNSEEESTRRAAFRALTHRHPTEAVPALFETVAGSDPELAEAATLALREWRTPDAVAPLTAGIAHPFPDVRAAALLALREHRSPRAMPALTAALEDGIARVRREAVLTLARVPDARVLPLLRLSLCDGDREVRQAAVAGLGLLRVRDVIPLLIRALSDVDGGVRQEAAAALGFFAEGESIDALRRALQDNCELVVINAILSLTRLRLPFSEVAHFLSDPRPALRAAAVQALEEIGDATARLRLQPFLRDRDSEAARAALKALPLNSQHRHAA